MTKFTKEQLIAYAQGRIERIIPSAPPGEQAKKALYEIALAALTAPQLPQPAVVTPNYSRFLSDVMTAAGLLSHGRRDKALATRLADFCVAERMGMDAPCRTAMLKESHRDLSYPVDLQVAEYEKIMQLALPDGWAAVPVEPTEDMVIAGFEAELREEFRNPEAWEAFEAMSGCEQAAHRVKLCWAAMIAAVPQQETKI